MYKFNFVVFFTFISLVGLSITRPNILLILGDDMGVDVLNGYGVGDNLPTTPNIDNLRENGVTFTNVWAYPVCSATRAAILTGKYGVNNGVNTVPGVLSTEHISIFSELDVITGGHYSTCVTGKWHLGNRNNIDHPIEHGADVFMGLMEAGVDDYFEWTKVENNETSTCQEYVTSYFTDFAVNWINDQTQPWFMWMAHVAPHAPIHTPPDGMYTLQGTKKRPRQYLAMIESLDFEIGRLLDSIPEHVLENTLVIFLGDNGTPGNLMQGYPDSKKGKGTVYQGGVHVPMIISGKGVERFNEIEDALIHVSDLYATIMQVATQGTYPINKYDSYSFLHTLTGEDGNERNYNFSEMGKNDMVGYDSYAIRDLQYKLIHVDGREEFYDLYNDPFETEDLVSINNLSADQNKRKLDLEQQMARIRGISTCEDGIKNSIETGIDCGGDCLDCQNTDTSDDDGIVHGYPIVHTGVDQFYNSSAIISVVNQSNRLYWQDGGRKLNMPSYTNNGDGTVSDNVTGLMWQKRMDHKMTYSQALLYADSIELGGYNDWRLPTIKELYSLILFTGRVKGESAIDLFIDTNYFNHPLGDLSAGEREIDAQTWSSTHYNGLTMKSDTTVFGVNFVDGRIKGYPKYTPRTGDARKMYFRLVRGNKNYGKNLFVENGNGTVTDSSTMLMWQQADDGTGRDWESAIEYCENLKHGGYNDWHLPNIKELHSIVDYTRSPDVTSSAAIDSLFFITEITDPEGNGGQYPYFWSTTTHLDGINPYSGAAYVAFGKAQGYMHDNLMDVHGAGAQRSDPKEGNSENYPKYFGPQGDVQIVYNHCRCMRSIVDDITGSRTNYDEGIHVYPNPTGNFLYISLARPASYSEISVYDTLGKHLLVKKIDSNKQELNLAGFCPGVYYLKFSGGEQLPFVKRVEVR